MKPKKETHKVLECTMLLAQQGENGLLQYKWLHFHQFYILLYKCSSRHCAWVNKIPSVTGLQGWGVVVMEVLGSSGWYGD